MKIRDVITRLLGLPDGIDSQVSESAALKLEAHHGLSGQSMVTLSTQDWADLWTGKQRFMLQFARQGNRVLYVETQFHWVTYLRLFTKHWRRIFLFLLGARQIEPNLYLYTPPILLPAFQIFPPINTINNFVLGILIRSILRRLSFRDPILWLYTHYNRPLEKKLRYKKSLYFCVDELPDSRGMINREVARKQEAETLESVDSVITTTDILKRAKNLFNGNIHVVSNGANVAHLNKAMSGGCPEPQDLKVISKPRLVFVGGISYWLDLELLRHMAMSRPNWQIVMIGPVMTDIGLLKNLENVHFLGRKNYDYLPDYLAWCDVALNPYKVDDMARGCSPLKLYEYIAAGLPVVSSEMPEARRFDGLVRVAANGDDFVAGIEEILSLGDATRSSNRHKAYEESQNHSWEKRFLDVEEIVEEMLI
jgi:glycosyltransferase involved in cell wall biosynthesis